MRHLFASTVTVLRSVETFVDGETMYSWQSVAFDLPCRLDLTFSRPGKDLLPVIEAGRAPDRVGLCFLPPDAPVRTGDRLQCTAGPVTGTFSLDPVPDQVQAFSTVHHLEVQVREVAQSMVW